MTPAVKIYPRLPKAPAAGGYTETLKLENSRFLREILQSGFKEIIIFFFQIQAIQNPAGHGI